MIPTQMTVAQRGKAMETAAQLLLLLLLPKKEKNECDISKEL